MSEDEGDKSPLTGADRIRLAVIMAEPDDDSLTRYSDVPGLAEPKDPLRPKTRDETYAKVRSFLDIILEVTVGRERSNLQGDVGFDGLVVRGPKNGKIKKKRYAKRGGGYRRQGRPPDLTLREPFRYSESWNMGVYPGRGPALISRADMIMTPPTTPSAITFKDSTSTTLSAGFSGHSAAGDTLADTL